MFDVAVGLAPETFHGFANSVRAIEDRRDDGEFHGAWSLDMLWRTIRMHNRLLKKRIPWTCLVDLINACNVQPSSAQRESLKNPPIWAQGLRWRTFSAA